MSKKPQQATQVLTPQAELANYKQLLAGELAKPKLINLSKSNNTLYRDDKKITEYQNKITALKTEVKQLELKRIKTIKKNETIQRVTEKKRLLNKKIFRRVDKERKAKLKAVK